MPFKKADGHDVSGDGRKDAGKLAEGSYKFYNDGNTFLGAAYLRHRDPKQTANRDINHDGVFDNADTWSNKDGDTMIDTGELGMYIHRGGNNTWSAGCQTLPPAQHTKFFKTLRKKQKDFTYVLVNVQ